MAFIGIDLGTSFIKAAVLDLDGYHLRHIRRVPFPDPIPNLDPGRIEFDPGKVMGAVNNLLREMENIEVNYEGLLLCTQMSCLVLTNEKGTAKSNCIGWRDRRALQPHPSGTGSYHDVLKQRITPQQRLELGNEMPPGCPLAFLFWMAERGQLESGLVPLSMGDFVLSQLCGVQPGVDTTNAMAYELLDLGTLQWHAELIKHLHLENLHWPAIRKHGAIAGSVKLSGKIVPGYVSVGDYQCALAGALLTDDEISLNVSTGSQVSRLTSGLSLGDFQTRPFFDGKFTNTVSHLPAGRSLNVLLDLLTEIGTAEGAILKDSWGYIARSVAAINQTDLEVNLSFFPGPRGSVGHIANIQEGNLTVAALFKAAFENMATNYYDCALQIWPDRSWANIIFSGGLARKLTILRDIIERRFQSESRLCPLEEDTLLGLMVLALAFSGKKVSVEQAMQEISAHYASRTDQEKLPVSN